MRRLQCQSLNKAKHNCDNELKSDFFSGKQCRIQDSHPNLLIIKPLILCFIFT